MPPRPAIGRLRSLFALALAVALPACRSVAVKDNVPARGQAPAIAVAPPPASAAASIGTTEAPETPLAWGTRAPKDGILFPIVDGMCIHGVVQRLENAVVFTYGTGHGVWSRGAETTGAVVAERGLATQPGYGFTTGLGAWSISELGGRYPDQLWALIDTSSRMTESSTLRVGGETSKEWTLLLSSKDLPGGGEWNNSQRSLGRPLELAGGALAFPERIVIPTDDGSMKSRFGFEVLDRSHALVAKPKVPGPDLAEIAFGRSQDATVFASGEVVGLRQPPLPKLVRWSPEKAVDDLAIPASGKSFDFVGGRTRAFVRVDSRLFVYEGERFAPARLDGRVSAQARMAIGDDDALYVALPEKKLLIDPPGAAITEEAIPAFGSLVTKRLGRAIWLSASNPTALHRRRADGRGWEPVPIPPPPFGTPLRGPLAIEGILPVAPDDVYVNVRRVEKGWGWHEPEPYRAIYRTKRPEQILRCQDVRREETGKGLHAWPPAADDACTTPFVVLRDDPGPGSASYADLAGKLRGKTELGEQLSFVRFDGRGTQVLGIPMADVDRARKLATLVSQSLDYRADVVCGRPPSVKRELVFDVAKGTFTPAR